jgi:hypothetical protein
MLSEEMTCSAGCPHCLQRWVLVVHDDFSEVADLQRVGNDVDVANLRRVFSVERGYQFAELARQHSSNILLTLAILNCSLWTQLGYLKTNLKAKVVGVINVEKLSVLISHYLQIFSRNHCSCLCFHMARREA